MLSNLGRWTTQLAIAIGASLVYALGLGLLGSMYGVVTRDDSSYAGQIASLEVTQQGQLAYRKYGENYAQIITTLSGEEIKNPVTIYAASVHWKRESNAWMTAATWNQRVASFVTKGKDDVVWTLVLDHAFPDRLYFTAVSVLDRAILGYLGRQGFQQTIPRSAEMIPFDYEHQDPYYFLMQAGFTFNHTTTEFDPNYRNARRTFPSQWPIVSQGQLLVIDFENRKVTARPEVGECHSLSMVPFPQYFGEGSQYVVVQKDRLIVDPLGAARTIRLPPRLQQTDGFSLYLPETGEVLAMDGGIIDRKYHITRFTDAGVVTSEEDQTLPDSDIMRRQSQTPAELAAIVSSMFPIPLVLLIVAVISGKVLGWGIATGVTAAIGVGVLCFISRWRKLTYSWSWIAAAIVLGPCVGITLWATQRRLAAPLAPPQLTGCEVYG